MKKHLFIYSVLVTIVSVILLISCKEEKEEPVPQLSEILPDTWIVTDYIIDGISQMDRIEFFELIFEEYTGPQSRMNWNWDWIDGELIELIGTYTMDENFREVTFSLVGSCCPVVYSLKNDQGQIVLTSQGFDEEYVIIMERKNN